MMETDAATILALVSTALIGYFLIALVPRVDDMIASYRKFAALTALGISYLVVGGLFMSILINLESDMTVGVVLALGVAGFLLFGVTLLYDVADDWLRLFADPEYNTWVEASLVLGLVVILAISFFAING